MDTGAGGTSTITSVRTIPRPWLSKTHNYGVPKPSPVEVWDNPKWSVSWEKLSKCFCCRTPNTEKHRTAHRDVPFPAFPAIRRNSSWSVSYTSFGHEHNYSMSSFSKSDSLTSLSTSSSSVLDARRPEYRTTAPMEASILPSVAATPPPPPEKKPPITTARRSATLPPRGSGIIKGFSPIPTTPNLPTPRGRCGTGEYSRMSVTTNASSRHRRLDQFQFSPVSMERILHGDDKGIPPPVVLCQQTRQVSSTSACTDERSYISLLEDTEDEEDNIWLYDDEDSASPFAQLERKIADEERIRRAEAASKKKKQMRHQVSCPMYLRKNPEIDLCSSGRVVLSGWVAVVFDEGKPESSLRRKFSQIKRHDLFYLRILEEKEQTSVFFHDAETRVVHTWNPAFGWICESKEISTRIGRCVLLRDPSQATVAAILPVSLDDYFFISPRGKEELVRECQFSRLRERMFAQGSGKVYAPDEQHDAAMYIMFSLDALIKGCSR